MSTNISHIIEHPDELVTDLSQIEGDVAELYEFFFSKDFDEVKNHVRILDEESFREKTYEYEMRLQSRFYSEILPSELKSELSFEEHMKKMKVGIAVPRTTGFYNPIEDMCYIRHNSRSMITKTVLHELCHRELNKIIKETSSRDVFWCSHTEEKMCMYIGWFVNKAIYGDSDPEIISKIFRMKWQNGIKTITSPDFAERVVQVTVDDLWKNVRNPTS